MPLTVRKEHTEIDWVPACEAIRFGNFYDALSLKDSHYIGTYLAPGSRIEGTVDKNEIYGEMDTLVTILPLLYPDDTTDYRISQPNMWFALPKTPLTSKGAAELEELLILLRQEGENTV